MRLLLLAGLVLAGRPAGDDPEVSLKRLTDLADAIVVARVERPLEVPPGETPLVAVAVETVLCGAPGTTALVLRTEPGSPPRAGERALLFLRAVVAPLPEALAPSAGGLPPCELVRGALGSFALARSDGHPVARVPAGVDLPRSLGPASPVPESRTVARAALFAWIERRLAKDRLLAPAHPEHGLRARFALFLGEPRADAAPARPHLVAALWGDGDFVYSKNGVRGGPPHRRVRVDAERIARLSERLERESDGWEDLIDRFDDEDLEGLPTYHLVVRDEATRERVRIPAETLIRDRAWHAAVDALLDLRPWLSGESVDDFEVVLR